MRGHGTPCFNVAGDFTLACLFVFLDYPEWKERLLIVNGEMEVSVSCRLVSTCVTALPNLPTFCYFYIMLYYIIYIVLYCIILYYIIFKNYSTKVRWISNDR